MNHKFTVEELKIRLDRYLANKLPEISRSQIQRDIERGKVAVNGETVTSSHLAVRLHDQIAYTYDHTTDKNELKATNTPLKVLYNNHGLIIIDKPAGLTVHPGAGFKGETLASALLYNFKDIQEVGEEHRPGIVHRLDKDTSGVILVAKTPQMYEHLKNAFADRRIKKEYLALVAGKVEKPHGFIETPIGKSKTDFRKMTTKNPVEGKPAVTEYKVLEHLQIPPPAAFGGTLPQRERVKKSGAAVDSCTLLLVKLHTGRTHQIRVHMDSLGHPLMGDQLYGPRLRSGSASGKKIQLPNLHRQFLHAKRIEVQLPDKTWIEAESDFPEDLKEVLKNLHSKIVNQL